MTSSTPTKAIPNPAVLVYGKPTSPDLPQASWFRTEDIQAAKAAAVGLNFLALELKTEADKALAVGVHEGVLKGSGRMIVGSVTLDVYKRIEDYAAKASAAPVSKAINDAMAGTKPASEQNKNTDDKGAAATSTAKAAPTAPDGKTEPTTAAAPSDGNAEPLPARDPWDALRVGSHVVGKYWEKDGTAYGWWLGVITAIDGNDFMIRWPDEPGTPPLKIERKHVAILHPTLDVNYEWVKRR